MRLKINKKSLSNTSLDNSVEKQMDQSGVDRRSKDGGDSEGEEMIGHIMSSID